MTRRGVHYWLLAEMVLLVFGIAPSANCEPCPRVAVFQVDVTPLPDTQPLIWVDPPQTIETPLLAKGLVFEHVKNRYVVCAIDWCGICNASYDLLRSRIANRLQIPPTNVVLHTVHQHTAPYVDHFVQELLDQSSRPCKYVDRGFLEACAQRIAAAAYRACARLRPFNRVGLGQAVVYRVASSRRLVTEECRFVARMSSCRSESVRALPEGNVDRVLRTITLARDEQPIVRLHFYATHPQSFYGDNRVSWDVPGFACARLERKEGIFHLYFTGCAGDVAMGKYNDGSPAARAELTDRLADAMMRATSDTRWFSVSAISWRALGFCLPQEQDSFRMQRTEAILHDATKSPVERIRAGLYLSFARQPTLVVSSLELGPAVVVFLPGECCIEYQQFCQRLIPDRFVAVAAYGNLGPGYICTSEAFLNGGYEPTASRVLPQSESLLKAAIMGLLEQREFRFVLCGDSRQ